MARSYYRRRRGYRRWKRYFRRWYRKAYKKGSSRIINNSSRTRVTIKTRDEASFHCRQLAGWGTTVPSPICPWLKGIDVVDSLKYLLPVSCQSTNAFRAFCEIYGEVRLTKCKVNIQLLTPLSEIGDTGLTIYTCWDRRMVYNHLTSHFPSVAEIVNSPSSKQVTCLPHTVNSVTRMVWPSDLNERINWSSTIMGTANVTVPDLGGISVSCPDEWSSNTRTDTFFCPGLWLVMDPHNSPEAGRNILVHVTMNCTFEFRSPRFGQAAVDRMRVAGSFPVEEDIVRETPAATDEAMDDEPKHQWQIEPGVAETVGTLTTVGALYGGAVAGPAGAAAGAALGAAGAGVHYASKALKRRFGRDKDEL